MEYYLPVPGGQIKKGKLEVNIALPDMTVQYSVDNGITWKDYRKKVSVSNAVLLRTKGTDGRYSRVTKVN